MASADLDTETKTIIRYLQHFSGMQHFRCQIRLEKREQIYAISLFLPPAIFMRETRENGGKWCEMTAAPL